MKKILKVRELCCSRCVSRLETALSLVEGVRAAKGNMRKNCVFLEVDSSLLDDVLFKATLEAGFEPIEITLRKGLFG